MYKLSVKPRLWLKSLHIVSASMWVGGGAAMLVLTLVARTAGVPAFPAYDSAVQVVDNWVTIPGGVAAMSTGLCFSLFTSWGFFKHTWVTVKWVITVSCILSGALWLGPTLGKVAEMSATAVTGPAYVMAHQSFFAWHATQTALVLFMVVISTLKPWRRGAARDAVGKTGAQAPASPTSGG